VSGPTTESKARGIRHRRRLAGPALAGRGAAVDRLARVRRRAASERRWLRLSLTVGVVLIALVVLLSLLQPLLPIPAPNHQDYEAVLQAPSSAHLFGTDDVGRDIFSRTLAAGRLDLSIAVLLTLISIVIGVTVGAMAGFFGGKVDGVFMRLVDVALGFPFIILVIGLIAIVGPGLEGVIIGVPLVGWAVYARLARAEMLVVRGQDYMLAAEVLGLSARRRLLRHALPNIWRPLLAFSMIDIVLNIMLIASLSFLGLGVQPPTPEWGAIIAEGQQYLLTAWWISILPGIVVVLVGFGFSLVGDAAADLLSRDLSVAAD
jgi:peptide/nickel transport system permease protein